MARQPSKKKQEEAAGTEEDEGGAFVVDMSGVSEKGDFPLLPRGIYNCITESVEFGYSNASGNPMWTWNLVVQEGEYADSKLWYYTAFTEKTMSQVKRALLAVGQTDLAESTFDPEEVASQGTLDNLALRARVDIKKYEGEDRNNVKSLLPAGEGAGFGV